MKTSSRLTYEFGPYRLDLTKCQLSRNGEEIILRPKLFDLLVVLVEHCGQMLEKEALLDSVWKDSVVEESNLTVSINALRHALGDHYIETVSRRGYRFAATVRVVPLETAVIVRPRSIKPDSPGGAVPLHSHFYIPRAIDAEFNTAISRGDSIVLVKGARQVGKTSLLARGLQMARESDLTIVLTDFQQFTATTFETVEKLLLTLAESICDQLDLPTKPHQIWNSFLSPGSNFERYLRREVLTKLPSPLVWGLDEVDRLFSFDYASEIFGLFRSWHNLRALDPAGPWQRITLAIAYATEAHLFITDLNQSPFNVGMRLMLNDFTLDQVSELNQRYGQPLRDEREIERFYQLLAGHPYLTQRGLYEMVTHKLELVTIESQAKQEEGIFADHLQRMLLSLERDPILRDALRNLLDKQTEMAMTHFYRLRSAGVLAGNSPQNAQLRCQLYTDYFSRHLL